MLWFWLNVWYFTASQQGRGVRGSKAVLWFPVPIAFHYLAQGEGQGRGLHSLPLVSTGCSKTLTLRYFATSSGCAATQQSSTNFCTQNRYQWGKHVLRSRSRGAEIKLPSGAGAVITNYGSGSGSGSWLFYQRVEELKKFYSKIMVASLQGKKSTQVKEGNY